MRKLYSQKPKVVIVTLALILIMAILFSFSNETGEPSKISVQGQSEDEIQPELYRVTLGYRQTGEDAGNINQEVTAKVNDLKNKLIESNLIEEEEIINENPNIYSTNNRDMDEAQVTVSHTFTIESAAIENMNDALSIAQANEINILNNLEFDLTKETRKSIETKLIDEAVQDAKLKAESAADSSGLRLKDPFELTVVESNFNLYRSFDALETSKAGYDIAEQSVSVQARVQIIYNAR